MNNTEIDSALEKLGVLDRFKKYEKGDVTVWEFAIGDTPSFIQTQTSVKRIRIVAKIGDPRHSEKSDLMSLMEANYHSTLDCRYAIVDGRLVATFIHPLEELTEAQFISGLFQVISCTLTCGGENSGGTLAFGKPGGKRFGKSDLLSSLSKLDLNGATLNVNIYQGNVKNNKVQQNQNKSVFTKKGSQKERIDWWRYVIVPILLAIIAGLVAILKGWVT